MKIAMTHVDLPNESKGGVAHQVHHLANALTARGHEVTMFTYSPPFAECLYHVKRYPGPVRPRRLQSFAFAVRLAQTDFSGFDVLHTNGDNYLLQRRSPQIRTFYGSAKDEAEAAVRLRRRLYQSVMTQLEFVGSKAADLNVGISDTTRMRLPNVSAIVPCGVDITRFRPGVKADHPVILFVGTTGGRKRGEFLADLFRREIRPRFPSAELWSVAERPMDGDGIINHGRVSLEKLTHLYQQAWVFCLPSTYEGFGVPYIEAMASGTSVVASQNPGAQEVLDGGRFGILAKDAQIGEEINSLLADAKRRQMYVEQGLERSQTYSWDRVAQQYEAHYESLVERHGTQKATSQKPKI
jgi:phosphatidylinositol alpha-mannosyltransferase